MGVQKVLRLRTIRTSGELIVAILSLAFIGNALAGEATKEYYRGLKPGQQMAKICFNEFGQLVLTPSNVYLCADLPAVAPLEFDITPRPELARDCYDRDGKLVITPRNVDLCSSLPTAAIVSTSPGGSHVRSTDAENVASVDVDSSSTDTNSTDGGGTDGGGTDGGGTDGGGTDGGGTDGGGPSEDNDGNNGHGNNADRADSSNPGKGPKNK